MLFLFSLTCLPNFAIPTLLPFGGLTNESQKPTEQKPFATFPTYKFRSFSWSVIINGAVRVEGGEGGRNYVLSLGQGKTGGRNHP